MSERMVFVTIEATESQLNLTLQDKRMMQVCWRAEFKSYYIEEITRKTGRQMSYEEFLVMLDTSILGLDPSIFIDLLGA